MRVFHSKRGRRMSIYVVGPNDGEQSGGGPIRVRIIEDGSHTGHRLGLIEATVPPGPFIGTMTPDLYIEYFRDLGRLPVNEQGMLNPADIGRTMANYATDVVR